MRLLSEIGKWLTTSTEIRANSHPLEEMTRKAIEKLSQNPNGFFLMVEGSKVDWAAHANDPVGMATDMLAFDRACGAALEFARQNGRDCR